VVVLVFSTVSCWVNNQSNFPPSWPSSSFLYTSIFTEISPKYWIPGGEQDRWQQSMCDRISNGWKYLFLSLSRSPGIVVRMNEIKTDEIHILISALSCTAKISHYDHHVTKLLVYRPPSRGWSNPHKPPTWMWKGSENGFIHSLRICNGKKRMEYNFEWKWAWEKLTLVFCLPALGWCTFSLVLSLGWFYFPFLWRMLFNGSFHSRWFFDSFVLSANNILGWWGGSVNKVNVIRTPGYLYSHTQLHAMCT